jgi:putative ABC transport system substrate-binding protein
MDIYLQAMTRRAVLVMVLGCVLLAVSSCERRPQRVVIVNPSRHGERIVNDVLDELSGHADPSLRDVHFENSGRIPDLDELADFVRLHAEERPLAFLAMTDEGISIVEESRDTDRTMLLYWMHSHPDDLARDLGYDNAIPNATGVSLGLSPTSAEDLRMDYLLRLIPDARQVLVVYNPDDADARRGMEGLRRVTTDHGVQIVEGRVESAHDAIDHLDLVGEVDGVFLAPDRLIGMAASDYYDAARMHGVPLAAPNTSSVARGALVSYTFSEESVASLLTRMLEAVIVDGREPAELPPQLPEFELALNLSVAQEIGVDISPAFLQEVDVLLE